MKIKLTDRSQAQMYQDIQLLRLEAQHLAQDLDKYDLDVDSAIRHLREIIVRAKDLDRKIKARRRNHIDLYGKPVASIKTMTWNGGKTSEDVIRATGFDLSRIVEVRKLAAIPGAPGHFNWLVSYRSEAASG